MQKQEQSILLKPKALFLFETPHISLKANYNERTYCFDITLSFLVQNTEDDPKNNRKYDSIVRTFNPDFKDIRFFEGTENFKILFNNYCALIINVCETAILKYLHIFEPQMSKSKYGALTLFEATKEYETIMTKFIREYEIIINEFILEHQMYMKNEKEQPVLNHKENEEEKNKDKRNISDSDSTFTTLSFMTLPELTFSAMRQNNNDNLLPEIQYTIHITFTDLNIKSLKFQFIPIKRRDNQSIREYEEEYDILINRYIKYTIDRYYDYIIYSLNDIDVEIIRNTIKNIFEKLSYSKEWVQL